MGIVVDEDTLARIVAERRAQGQRIALTNGIFDVLHLGHVRYLCQARALADALIVAVNADESARRLKGSSRPIVPQADRAEVVAALACVDFVTIFADDTATRVIERLRPDIYVKGADYASPDGAARQRDYVLTGDELRQVLSGASTAYPQLIGLGERLGEARAVASYGGGLALLSYLPEHSTSALLARIRAMHDE
jgi:rfaE bifunctional protein nucleotidyltransferase chain/domain